MSNQSYHDQQDSKNIKLLRNILDELPDFARDYFRAGEISKSTQTLLSYAHDLKIFFQFLYEHNPSIRTINIKKLPISILEELKPVDIEEYQQYLKLFYIEEKEIKNKDNSIIRKMSSLRSFYSYYQKHQVIEKNPTTIVEMPKQNEKAIIRLDPDEIVLLLEYIEDCGKNLTKKKKDFYDKIKTRDLALVTLMLGTGIRVSECVGLDLNDVDFRNGSIRIIRKGGNESLVYFGQEVEAALLPYMEERKQIHPVSGHENALFLSLQKKRINVRSVQYLVKGYAQAVTSSKKITPHKLRSTYGTNLYKETGDIYLVADALGHKDISTTRKHYSAMDESQRRRAASAIKLREP